MLLRLRPRPNGFIEPCLPSPAPKPPAGPGWIHEIKHDGFRLMARRDPAGVRLLTRRGLDWTGRYLSNHERGSVDNQIQFSFDFPEGGEEGGEGRT